MNDFKSKGDSLAEQFDSAVRNAPVIGSLIRDGKIIDNQVHSLRNLAYKPIHLTYNNAYLAGDAAWFVDPINSAGILNALYSGYMAFWTIDNSLKNPKRNVFYKEVYESQFALRLNLLKLLAYALNVDDESDLIKYSRQALKKQSQDEVNLMVSQLLLTNRPENLLRNLKKAGIPFDAAFEELKIPEFGII
jgi:flavin-dependent dehydrogenase